MRAIQIKLKMKCHLPFSLLSSSHLLFALVFFLLFLRDVAAGSFLLCACGLADDSHHVLLEGLLLEEEAVLVPDEVGCLNIEVVTLHAALKQIEDVAVVGVSSETEAAAVLHEFFEFSRLVQAELVYGDLFLFSPDVIIFLVL